MKITNEDNMELMARHEVKHFDRCLSDIELIRITGGSWLDVLKYKIRTFNLKLWN